MADRIIVLGTRPASIKKIVPIELTVPGKRTPANARNAKEFPEYFNLIWKEINHV